jgi:hypothetical protein
MLKNVCGLCCSWILTNLIFFGLLFQYCKILGFQRLTIYTVYSYFLKFLDTSLNDKVRYCLMIFTNIISSVYLFEKTTLLDLSQRKESRVMIMKEKI